ncbi:MAG: type II secretion system F family protein [Lachnospiraceae bacterium]|nr:type II secretion system F family protein [Lachnospiraceae bacterium]
MTVKLEMRYVVPVLYSGLYFVLAGLVIALAVLSFREDVPAYARDPPCFMPLRKMAVFLYRKLLEYREKRRRKGKDLLIPGEEGVRNDFSILYPSLKARRREIVYRIMKTERILLLLIAGMVFAGVLHFQSLGAGIMQDGGRIERSPAGGADRRVSVTARPASIPEEDSDKETESGFAETEGQKGKTSVPAETEGQIREKSASGETGQQGGDERERKKDYGTYTVTVHARRLTRPEAEKLAERILKQFPDCLLGENTGVGNIRFPLKMPQEAELSPFVPDWESSRYAVLDTDGSIFNSEYTEEQAEQVDLTVHLTYGDWRFDKKMSFTVRAPVRDEETMIRGEIQNTLKEAEKKSAAENTFVLPSEADGIALTWEEKTEDVSPGILVMGILICMCAWYIMDSRLHEQTIGRSRQLAIDYPRLISRIVLYLGAGMSVRNVFYTCASEYRQQRAAESKKMMGKKAGVRYLYEEILLVCNELDSGIPEAEAYMHFGRRCRSRQYTKLCSLLVQNLRRGNDTLLAILQVEAQNSFEERKNLARELGEEAGTKLLLPMMIMLGVTMLIIIVPAYFSFSM